MYRFLTALLSVACLCIAGCGAQTEVKEKNANQKGLEIKVPGVEIKVNEQDGISVKAPETDVKVNKEGVEVNAPGTDVKIKPSGDADGSSDPAKK